MIAASIREIVGTAEDESEDKSSATFLLGVAAAGAAVIAPGRVHIYFEVPGV
jgi:hypothetical protein